MGPLNIAAVIAVHAIAVVATLFVILYMVRSAWTRNAGGRSVVIMALGFAAFVDEVTIRFWFPLADTPGRRVLDLITYLIVLAGWVWLLINLLQAQRRAKREQQNTEEQ